MQQVKSFNRIIMCNIYLKMCKTYLLPIGHFYLLHIFTILQNYFILYFFPILHVNINDPYRFFLLYFGNFYFHFRTLNLLGTKQNLNTGYNRQKSISILKYKLKIPKLRINYVLLFKIENKIEKNYKLVIKSKFCFSDSSPNKSILSILNFLNFLLNVFNICVYKIHVYYT